MLSATASLIAAPALAEFAGGGSGFLEAAFVAGVAFFPIASALAILARWRPSRVLRRIDFAILSASIGIAVAVMTGLFMQRGYGKLEANASFLLGLTLAGGLAIAIDSSNVRRFWPIVCALCFVIGFASMAPAASCPHARHPRLPAATIVLSGKPCRNPQFFGPWWIVLQR